MSLFVDASALVAIIANEPEGDALAAKLAVADDAIWSAISCWETISALCSSHGYDLFRARLEVEDYAVVAPLRLVEVGDAERLAALDAYQTYGKRSRHRARLNMGDCFAYACARTNHARLLYKGDDFSHTDLA